MWPDVGGRAAMRDEEGGLSGARAAEITVVVPRNDQVMSRSTLSAERLLNCDTMCS